MTEEIKPGLTVEEKKSLITDLNEMMNSIGEIDRGLISSIISTNATHKLLIAKGLVTKEELMKALTDEFQLTEQAAIKAMDEAGIERPEAEKTDV